MTPVGRHPPAVEMGSIAGAGWGSAKGAGRGNGFTVTLYTFMLQTLESEAKEKEQHVKRLAAMLAAQQTANQVRPIRPIASLQLNLHNVANVLFHRFVA